MKFQLSVLVASAVLLVQACSPLGSPVDRDISDSYFYNKSKTDVVYSPMGNWFELEDSKIGADVESFEVLGRQIAKDKNRVYFQSRHVVNEDLSLEKFRAKDGYLKNNIGMDDRNVYQFKRDYSSEETFVKVIEGADPESFIMTDVGWARDNYQYYHNYKPVAVDYSSFKQVNSRFFVDKDSAYYHTYELFQAFRVDVESFKKIDDLYAYDKNAVYYFTEYLNDSVRNELRIIPNPDSRKIRVLNKTHLKSGDKMYYKGFEIKDADISGFEVISEYYARDNNLVYYEGIAIPNADPESFHYDDKTYYYKDKNRSYNLGKPIDTTVQNQ